MAHLLASEKLGERLFEARQAAGLSMRQLAQKAGVGEATINDIEKARQMPAADTTERLARALSISPAWLAFGIGPQQPSRQEESADGVSSPNEKD